MNAERILTSLRTFTLRELEARRELRSLSVLEEMIMIVLAFSGCGDNEAWKWIDKEWYGSWQECGLRSKHLPSAGMALNDKRDSGC